MALCNDRAFGLARCIFRLMNVDEYPNREARERAWHYERLSKLDDISAFKLGAEGTYDTFHRCFDEAAR